MRVTYDDNNYIEEALNQSDSTWVGVFCLHEPHMLGVLLFSQLSEVEFFSVREKQKVFANMSHICWSSSIFTTLQRRIFLIWGEIIGMKKNCMTL